jgi:hypothetical protein
LDITLFLGERILQVVGEEEGVMRRDVCFSSNHRVRGKEAGGQEKGDSQKTIWVKMVWNLNDRD